MDGCDGVTDEIFDILLPNKYELEVTTEYDNTLAKIEKMRDAHGKIIHDRAELLFESQITSGYANSSVDPFSLNGAVDAPVATAKFLTQSNVDLFLS